MSDFKFPWINVVLGNKNKEVYIYPEFVVPRTTKAMGLLVRGGKFQAIYDPESGLWKTEFSTAIAIIDDYVRKYAKEKWTEANIPILRMAVPKNGLVKDFNNLLESIVNNSEHLDSKLVFSDQEVKMDDYATSVLPYPFDDGVHNHSNWTQFMSRLYSPEDLEKIEWCIGSLVTGGYKKQQKMLVIYGAPGCGKSTVTEILEEMFPDHFGVFDAKKLCNANATFAMQSFREHKMYYVDADSDMSRINDNTNLNKLVAHDSMDVELKNQDSYLDKFQSFLICLTNSNIRFTDANSGLIRRVIDCYTSNNLWPTEEYEYFREQIRYEFSGICYHCAEVYRSAPQKYKHHTAKRMMDDTDPIRMFIQTNYDMLIGSDKICAEVLWTWYKEFCDECEFPDIMRKHKQAFRSEMRKYFRKYYDEAEVEGVRKKCVFEGFKRELFDKELSEPEKTVDFNDWLSLKEQPSKLDYILSECTAQYGNENETPEKSWENVTTKLKDLDTSKLHYILVPGEHIVIDFDIKDEFGNKCMEKNIEAARKFPKTYAELSKSGGGLHLHYIYVGELSKLKNTFDNDIEIKVYTGKMSLRRRLSKCNDLDVSTISSGLPKKEDKKMLDSKLLESEKNLRKMIEKNLRKEFQPSTAQSVSFIKKLLDDAYDEGFEYDVSDMKPYIQLFASNSTHQADKCLKMVDEMKFISKELKTRLDNFVSNAEYSLYDDPDIVFFDVEVFSNFNCICYKERGKDKEVIKVAMPTPEFVEAFIKKKLVGFNNLSYDNNILYAMLLGLSPYEVFCKSAEIVSANKGEFKGYRDAKLIGYADIFDILADKKSLKKWEIELGIDHVENEHPWDLPIPEYYWDEIMDYCANDVIATEAVWDANKTKIIARQMLSDLSGLSYATSTNNHTKQIIFGNEDPSKELRYTDLKSPSLEVSWHE